jgi:ATP-dependent DNA ligase
VPVWYYVFDVLQHGDRELMSRPYRERRQVLKQWPAGGCVSSSDPAPLVVMNLGSSVWKG